MNTMVKNTFDVLNKSEELEIAKLTGDEAAVKRLTIELEEMQAANAPKPIIVTIKEEAAPTVTEAAKTFEVLDITEIIKNAGFGVELVPGGVLPTLRITERSGQTMIVVLDLKGEVHQDGIPKIIIDDSFSAPFTFVATSIEALKAKMAMIVSEESLKALVKSLTTNDSNFVASYVLSSF